LNIGGLFHSCHSAGKALRTSPCKAVSAASNGYCDISARTSCATARACSFDVSGVFQFFLNFAGNKVKRSSR
jgi:hypothetical protein